MSLAAAVGYAASPGGGVENNDGGDDGEDPQSGGDGNSKGDNYEYSFKDYKNGSNLGISIEITYTGDVSQFSDLQWIQTFNTNEITNSSAVKIGSSHYLDVGGTGTDQSYPFYYSSSINAFNEMANAKHIFSDKPSRYYSKLYNIGTNTYWMAELTLIGKLNNSWKHITTFSYGWQIVNGQINRTQLFNYNYPVSNQQFINHLNRK